MSTVHTVATVEELPPGQRKLVFAGGRSILLYNAGGALHAYDNSCPHQGAALAGGKLEGHVLACPAHGLRFDLATGCMRGSAALCLTRFPLQAADGRLSVILPD